MGVPVAAQSIVDQIHAGSASVGIDTAAQAAPPGVPDDRADLTPAPRTVPGGGDQGLVGSPELSRQAVARNPVGQRQPGVDGGHAVVVGGQA